MPPVTADTNVYISGLEFGGLPMEFLSRALAGEFRLAASDPIQAEIRRVLRDKFVWHEGEITDALAQLATCMTIVHPVRSLAVVADDPDDDRIIECAVEAGSEYIVSGDNHLLRLGSYGGIQIIRVAAFLGRLPKPW